MKFFKFSRVLALSPHPDDTEYSIAGTVLKHKDTLFDIFCITQGGDCDITTGTSRLQEVVNAWKISGAENCNVYTSDSVFLKHKATEEWVNYIERTFLNDSSYDAILLPSSQDSHFEHVTVSSYGAALARVKPYTLIEYKAPSALETWVANTFIDISDVYETKKRMLYEFKSQLTRTYFNDLTIDGFHTHFQCSKKGLGYVEQFKINTIYQ